MLKTFIITTQNYCFNHGYSHKHVIQEIQQTSQNITKKKEKEIVEYTVRYNTQCSNLNGIEQGDILCVFMWAVLLQENKWL